MKKNTTRRVVAPVLALVTAFLGSWPMQSRAEESLPPAAELAGVQVARAVFARAVAEREPQDVVAEIDAGAEQIYFFTELLGMEGHTVRHRWEFQGEILAEIPFKVGAQRWRIYSSKRFLPGQTGLWTVSVVDESDLVLRSETLGRALASSGAASSTPPAAPDEP